MSYPKVCVGTKRGSNRGVVYAPDGTVIGRVFRTTKAARKSLGGGMQPFWTAEAIVGGVRAGMSLGTRHVERRDAVAAVLAFSREYPEARIMRALIRWWRTKRSQSHMLLTGDRYALSKAISSAVWEFKHDHWQACGLPGRTLPDPRAQRDHVSYDGV